jgi:hypothetical protein
MSPLLDFLIQVNFFGKIDYVAIKLTSWKPTQTLVSLQAHQHAFLKAWPKHDVCQKTISAKRAHLITKLGACVKVDRLPPSSFT